MSVPQNLIALLFLRAAPQDLPYSPSLTVKLVATYIFSGIVVLQSTLNPDDLIQNLLLGLLIQWGFTFIVLGLLNHEARFHQTFGAIMGIGALFNFLSWPIMALLGDATADDSVKATLSLLFLMLISWEVLVKAHIYKNALEMKMVSAMALSFSLLFITIALSKLIFPAEVAG